MKYWDGTYPNRVYNCPVDQQLWREWDGGDGIVVLSRISELPAVVNGPSTIVPSSPSVPTIRYVAMPVECDRPHINPLVAGLAVVGGIALIGAILRSGRRGG